MLPSNRAKLAVPLSLSLSLCWLWLDSYSYWTYMRVGSVGLLPSPLKWLFNCCGKLALLQLAFEKFISESENKTINNFHPWRQFGCSLRFNCTVFLFFFPPSSWRPVRGCESRAGRCGRVGGDLCRLSQRRRVYRVEFSIQNYHRGTAQIKKEPVPVV